MRYHRRFIPQIQSLFINRHSFQYTVYRPSVRSHSLHLTHPRSASTMLASQPLAPHLLASHSVSTNDYAEYDFALPEAKYVGLLACQRDPLLKTLITRVVRCEKKPVVATAPTAAAKANGKKVKSTTPITTTSSPTEPEEEWEIELLDTVLFPEGGGQPSDVGTLTPLRSDDNSPVNDGDAGKIGVRQVLRKNLDAVHFASKPIEVGTKVLVEVDWERRWDLMTCHTGQHLLSAVTDSQLQLDTLSWSLTPFPDPCYIELPRAPTATELISIQTACNQHILSSLPIKVKMSLPSSTTSGLGGKVPENYVDVRGGTRPPVLRTVEIQGIDSNPCCGTHLPSTSFLAQVHVSPHTTPIRGTNARVYFSVGERALRLLRDDETVLKGVGEVMGCAKEEFIERVGGMKNAYAEGCKREKRMREELAGFVAERLWGSSASGMNGADPGASPRKGLSFRQEDSTNSLEFLSNVSFALKERIEANHSKSLFILACGGTLGGGIRGGGEAGGSGGGALMVIGDEQLVMKAGKLISTKFGSRVKGGGKGRWQGKLSGDKWEKGDEALLKEILNEVDA